MRIYPAIDLLDGRVVRLEQGDFGRRTDYAVEPSEAARRFRDAGASCLHVVDLDGARGGRAANHRTIEAIVRETALFVQVGGGIRTLDRVRAYLDAGAGRVILGSAAVSDPEFLDRCLALFGDRIAVGVDLRDGQVMTHGWERGTGIDGLAFCRDLAARGVATVVATDIARDGRLEGTNLELYERLQDVGIPGVIASGGITTLDELLALRGLGVSGAVVGKALYAGRLRLDTLIREAEERS
ncbi:1-(5-phosphoribosyl)-5-[(5-phosphoribosylamino)methylideneamino]imidazole-4-carboxamide isomerase [Fretibacterium sp. OH1220_COT-178]|uniref:1-(5-phosphoribosyl)-5-[(5- phosphoribosylamino)methylideneamino]imidazole-4- carboxamide isomerase n=1 Tax=Fretibacterium sp. OH1220_COT-178 TaxID=2491047 RepID=UPI000F5F1EC3|nr:1-(5-phosphoribosyl)-5-[(5-phosphoribosylamino)methylideneamino]imidazole-4-carboxamide isomerase [Fretibacterium sp. OH1220_COT-178]RRD63616.1 1-(5-phosphoribosyl)-5-[(5-phosphoribosylamino)methylideneamino]imidazole-4-carboxamide isomerase [Fretibacterium sp. OH1220_COT-178]